jgi:hypothetical protein
MALGLELLSSAGGRQAGPPELSAPRQPASLCKRPLHALLHLSVQLRPVMEVLRVPGPRHLPAVGEQRYSCSPLSCIKAQMNTFGYRRRNTK